MNTGFLAMASLGCLWLLAPSSPLPWELSLLEFFARSRSPGLDRAMAALTWLGSLWLLLPLSLALFLGGRWRPMAALVATTLIGHAAKLLILRPRPQVFGALDSLAAGPAFPSLHTGQAAAFLLALALVRGRRSGFGLAALGVLVVAWSRLYLQVHFPADVLAGALLGATVALGLHRLWPAEPRATVAG